MWAGGGIDANVDEMAHYALLQVDDGTASGRRLVAAQMMADLHLPQIAEFVTDPRHSGVLVRLPLVPGPAQCKANCPASIIHGLRRVPGANVG